MHISYVFICACVQMRVSMCPFLRAADTYMYIYIYIYTFLHMQLLRACVLVMRGNAHVCVYVHICIWICIFMWYGVVWGAHANNNCMGASKHACFHEMRGCDA